MNIVACSLSRSSDPCQTKIFNNFEKINKYSKTKIELKLKLTGEKNVFNMPSISSGNQYFWRIDAIMPDGTISKGDVWSFKVQ